MEIPEAYRKQRSLPGLFSLKLKGIYDEREAGSIANLVIEELTAKTILHLFVEQERDWDEYELTRISFILDELIGGKPIQYILGRTEFFGLEFQIDHGVLIPRNETEELVEWVLYDAKARNKNCNILDIGCGSGAIAVSLARNLPFCSVFAVDINPLALSLTASNAEKHSINLVCGRMDILDPNGFFDDKVYDIIVSNPPYVLESQKPFLEKRVSEMEPANALFVPDTDPLMYYKAIISFGMKHLRAGGSIYVEINEQLAGETLREFEKHFQNTEIRRDIHGKNRMIKASNG